MLRREQEGALTSFSLGIYHPYCSYGMDA